jgi:hypothetical protein
MKVDEPKYGPINRDALTSMAMLLMPPTKTINASKKPCGLRNQVRSTPPARWAAGETPAVEVRSIATLTLCP